MYARRYTAIRRSDTATIISCDSVPGKWAQLPERGLSDLYIGALSHMQGLLARQCQDKAGPGAGREGRAPGGTAAGSCGRRPAAARARRWRRMCGAAARGQRRGRPPRRTCTCTAGAPLLPGTPPGTWGSPTRWLQPCCGWRVRETWMPHSTLPQEQQLLN